MTKPEWAILEIDTKMWFAGWDASLVVPSFTLEIKEAETYLSRQTSILNRAGNVPCMASP